MSSNHTYTDGIPLLRMVEVDAVRVFVVRNLEAQVLGISVADK